MASARELDTLPPKIAESPRHTLREGRGIADVETIIAGRDNDLIPIAMSSSAFDNTDNEDLCPMALIYNMTQIKRLESSVKRADRLTSIGTMAAGMAHEIKNPLQSIKTFSQLLLERFEDPDFRKTFAGIRTPEVQRIDTIVTRLLDFARPRPVQFAPTTCAASSPISRPCCATSCERMASRSIWTSRSTARPSPATSNSCTRSSLNLF